MSISPTVAEDSKKYPDLVTIDDYFNPSEEKSFDATPDSGIHDILSVDPEQRAKYEEDWKAELAKTEEEIATLRQVLCAKVRYAQELKRKLGITPWKELKDDVEQSFRSIQETPAIKEVGGKLVEWNSALTSAPIFPGIFSSSAYQKTSQTLKTAGMKTSTALAGFGSSMTKKLGEVKNSPTYRSFEQRMESAYASVKSKVNNTRSTSLYSIEDALNNSDHRSAGFSSAAATPTTTEKCPLP